MRTSATVARAADPTAGRWTRRQWATLFVACAGLFVTQLDLTVVNVGLGAIGRRLDAPTSAVTWVVDAYLVTFAAFMVGFGDLGDLLGRRRVFVTGLTGFGLASTCCALAPGVGWLVAGRAAQGVAGAAVLVSSLAILTAAFDDGSDRARAVGYWSAVAGVALVVGPLLGGVLVDTFGWRSLFWINVPVCAAGVVSGRAVLAQARAGGAPGEARRLDRAGQALAVTTLATCSWGLSEVAAHGRSVAGWVALLASAGFGAAFVAVERRVPAPLVPPGIFASRPFRAANAVSLLVHLGTLGLLYLISLSSERVHALSAAATGARIAPLFAAYVLASLFAGRVADRFGARAAGAVGAAAAAGGSAGVAAWTAAGSGATALALVLAGAGVGLAMPVMVTTAVASVPASRAGLASGLNNTARQIGGTIGVAVLGGIVAGACDQHLELGVRRALVAVAVAYLAAAGLALRLPPTASPPGRRG